MSFTDEKSRVWHWYTIDYWTSDGQFDFRIQALSDLHAEEILADIKERSEVRGRLVSVCDE